MMKALSKKRALVGNKGFSLVELIIVVAIMAVLVAVLAPQYLKYVDKSRQSADDTNADQLLKAVQVAMTDEDIAEAVGNLTGDPTKIVMNATNTTPTNAAPIVTELNKTLGTGWTDKKVTSNEYKNTASLNHAVFTITVDRNTGVASGAWTAS